jgi:hypothetical protein
MPALQLVAVAPSDEQARPHSPQWFTLVARLASQPLSGAGASGVSQSV